MEHGFVFSKGPMVWAPTKTGFLNIFAIRISMHFGNSPEALLEKKQAELLIIPPPTIRNASHLWNACRNFSSVGLSSIGFFPFLILHALSRSLNASHKAFKLRVCLFLSFISA